MATTTPFQIPTQPDFPWYKFKITLSGVIYTLRLRYNSRSQRWILDVADASNNDILNGCPVLIDRDIAGQYVLTGLPPGIFYASDDSNSSAQPTLDSFEIDHTLFYVEVA